MRWVLLVFVLGVPAGEVRAQGKVKAAREAAEFLIAKFGAKAGRSVPSLAGRIESIAARYGDDAVLAVRRGGPTACHLIESAGPNGAKAVRVLAAHGELGAARVLSRPAAMKQFLQYGDDTAAALVKHPGVAEDLVAAAGAPAVKALAAVGPQQGRRLAMLMEGELASAGRQPELLGVVAKHGDRAANFLWENKGTLAGGAALTAFLANPEPFLDGTNKLVGTASENVVKPVVGGVVTVLTWAVAGVVAVLASLAVLAHRHGLPDPHKVAGLVSLFRR